MARVLAVSVALIAVMLAGDASGQTQPPSDPQALTYAAQSVAAMSGGNTVTDVTLTGTANTWMVGSTADSGTITLKIGGYGESRIDMQLSSNGPWSLIRDSSTGVQQGEWLRQGASGQYSLQNCVTDAAWFYPLFSAMAVAPNGGIVLSYIGLETLGASQVQHLRSYYFEQGLDSGSQAQLQQTSTIDYYLDATTFLPIQELFSAFDDSGFGGAIPVQVLFLNYQSLGGVATPQEIQEYIGGTLQLDVSVTSVAVNTGIPISSFTIPQ
jgi:hypothetical protein